MKVSEKRIMFNDLQGLIIWTGGRHSLDATFHLFKSNTLCSLGSITFKQQQGASLGLLVLEGVKLHNEVRAAVCVCVYSSMVGESNRHGTKSKLFKKNPKTSELPQFFNLQPSSPLFV